VINDGQDPSVMEGKSFSYLVENDEALDEQISGYLDEKE
jgi:hypothetical protein